MAYLDPHEEIWPKETGQWYDIDKNMYSSDTFAPFEGLCGFSVHASHFAGTIFRFPLRNVRRQKRVSTHTYDVNKLHTLLVALREEAKCILLFLRSVRKVEVFEISQSGEHTNLLKVSICETSSDQLGSKRSWFQQNLKMLFEAQSFGIREKEKLSQVVRVQVDVHDHQQSQYSSTSKWLVANQVGSQSEEIRKLANALKVFPWVGVALETSAAHIKHSGGRVFCVLPMPLEVSCKLPVHVNGTFSINDERRELKWRGIERKNDPSAQWNHLLVDELLPPCYASLLLDHAKMLLEPEQFCRAWPDTNKVRGTHWEGLLRPLLQALFTQQVIPFRKSVGFFWVKVGSAIFVPRGTRLPSEVYTALVACGVKLVNVPDVVWHALDYCSIHPKCVSAPLTRAELRKCPGSYSGFSSNQKLKLLRYCLSDNEYGDLQNLALLPLANGNFGTFGTYCTSSVYLCSQQFPRYLLPNLNAELVDEDIEYQLYQKLSAIANSGYTNLQHLTANTVATLLPRAMPLEWHHQTTVTLPHSNFDIQWLQRFWRWVSGENLRLFSDQQLVPISDSTVTRLNKSLPSLFIPRTQSYSPSLVSCLKKLGVQCCEQKIHTFVRHNSELSSLMNFFSPEGIVDAIICASPSYGSVSLTDDEAVQLRTHIDRVTVNPRRKFTLRNIPMFVTLNENLCSVAEVERSTKRIAQIEPPSFSLSHKNLPSSVVLFSGSQSYQTRLLNSISVICTNTVDLLINIVFPIIEKGSGRNIAKLLMKEVLKKFDSITLNIGHCKREDFESAIAELPFLPVGVGKPKAPSTLYSPSDPGLRNLFHKEPVFPLDPFATGKCLSVLKSCGLKTTVSPQEIVDIITSIGPTATTAPVEVNKVQHKRAKAVLTYIRNWESQLSETVCIAGYSRYHPQMSLEFSEALKELSKTRNWLPVQTSPPPNYPSCLTWKGSGYSSHLVSFGSSVLLSYDQTSLAIACGSQMYFVDHSLSKSLCNVFASEPEDMVKHVMAHLKEVILNHKKSPGLEDVRRIAHTIYRILDKYAAQGYSMDLSLLVEDAEEFVWITKQKRFVHPNTIALEQNPTFRQNLEPFIYILPSDLEEFKSLFESLGVQCVVTKPQILGILEKIKNGNSNCLGISNSQAWQLVMAILNWLTDDGEQTIDEDDAESLLVPVEPDADWPALQVVEDVVYTDNNFLQSFLESSDEECEYTFVNHRVTPHLASQLQLTSLSKYLNIADDAFEDVGQSEPLTVRLKNILKDYKDGLTIIKELLQNADDAEASEMNICYDARHHIEKRRSLFFPGMAECHGPALVVNNNAMFTEEDFQNITKLAGATKEGKALKIGKFGVGFCSVYHITDIPSFVSKDWLYIFDPTLSYLKDQIKNPARPGQRVHFTSNFISRSKQLAPYVGLFDFDPQSSYKGTIFRLPFRTTASELSGKIYTANDVKQLMQQLQNASSKLLIFLQHVELVTFSQINGNDEFPTETMRISMTTETIVGSRHIHQVTCTVDGSPDITDYWLVEKVTETVLGKYSTASVACELCPLPDKESYEVKPVEGEMFCFLPLSKKTGLPVHVSSNFAVSNNRTGIWTSDEGSVRSDEVDWNESLMEGVICSAYCELLEGLKEMQSDDKLEEYEFFSMWPVDRELELKNPWQLSVKVVYETIKRKELFFSSSTEEWLAINNSKFLDPNILKVSHATSLPCAVLDIVNHLRLPIVNLPSKYHDHLDITNSTVTEKDFLDHFFTNIDELETIKDSKNTVLCLILECYATELDQQSGGRFCYLQEFLEENACVPCEPEGDELRLPSDLIHPRAYFAELFDTDEKVFPLEVFCSKKLVEEAMKELGMSHNSISLHRLKDRASGIATIYKQDREKAMKRAKLIMECLLNEDKREKFTDESCAEIAEIAFLSVLEKPADYPLPWKGDESRLYTGAEVVMKSVRVFRNREDYTNVNIAGSQAVFLNQDLPCHGGCGVLDPRVQEILQIRIAPNYTEVISHFELMISEFDGTPKMVKWADRISKKVYEFLENLLKPTNYQQEADISGDLQQAMSSLAETSCIWTGERYVGCSVVAKNWRVKGPYLYKIPDSMTTRKNLQKALDIKENFTVEDFVGALQSLKRDYGSESLSDNCQTLVKAIVPELPSQRDDDDDDDYGTIALPAVDFVMHESTMLYFNDMPWQPQDKEFTFVHPCVPLATAKALGVQLCRSASLARYSVPGSGFTIMPFGQHEELTRRIQNIIRDYPFDMTILKELLQNADDAKATKMHVILDMRDHSKDHIFSEEWEDLQGPALLVWNDSVFTEKDLEGIQSLGLGSKRSDSETIGQYGIGFNAVYHLTDCPSFVTGGNTLCILDPHMRYVPYATDRYPGAMYKNLDEKFWNSFDGIKTTYLRDGLKTTPKYLLGGSLFRFPLRHTPQLAKSSDIVKDISGRVLDQVTTSQKMCQLLEDWAPSMKQSLLFLNHVVELKFFVIRDRRGVLHLQNSFKTELDDYAAENRSKLTEMIKSFAREPFIATYQLTIVESEMQGGKDRREEWLIQQGIGDVQNKMQTWSYVEQVKPRHGIATPLNRDTAYFRGQVFCFLPLPLYSGLPVHINGHFILNSTRRNLWVPTDLERGDEKSLWNKNILQAIASSYAQFLERIPEYFTELQGRATRDTFEKASKNYYTCFPHNPKRKSLSDSWLELIWEAFRVMSERNSPVLAVPTNTSPRSSADKYLLHWHPLKSEQMPASQAYFWNQESTKLRSVLERIGMKITCAPIWIMEHFKEVKSELPVISRLSVFEFYTAFNKRFISDHYPRDIQDTPFKTVEDFNTFTEYLLEPQQGMVVGTPVQSEFPKSPFGYPLLLTADNQLRDFDQANKVLCSEHVKMFPECADRFLHKDLLQCTYSSSYFVSTSDSKTVCVKIVKELLETVLPAELKNVHVSSESKTIQNVDIRGLWKCFTDDKVFIYVLDEVLKVWALLMTKDNRLFRCGSSEQLLPFIPIEAATPKSGAAVAAVVEQVLKGPLLEVSVVPVETACSFCPQFSDHQRILKNLLYLHREHPFTEVISVHDAGVLNSYFAEIHLKKEPHCWQTLKCLPLSETVNGKLTELEGKRVYVWPTNICQEGNEKWQRGTNLVFLKRWASWTRLGVTSELGIQVITAEETYVQFIFQIFFKMSKQERYNHLKYIRDYLFKTNFVRNDIAAHRFVTGLKNLHCIGEDRHTLQPVSNFYTHKKTILQTFPEHFPTLPKDILQTDERAWMEFFKHLGLQEVVTMKVFISLCNDVARGKLRENTRIASTVLLAYLFSPTEAKHNGFHKDKHFLAKISDIAFVCPIPLPELEWIHEVPQAPNSVILVDNEEVPLCKLSGSCLPSHADLVWTVHQIVSVREKAEEHVLKGLGICIKPTIKDVLKNIKHPAKTRFADPQLFMKYTAPHHKAGQKELTAVMTTIFEYLQKSEEDVSELKALPCVPVYAISTQEPADVGQYPVLIKPHCVVLRPKEDTQPYYPFIHSAPEILYRVKDLMGKLGIQDSLQLKHMQVVLETAYKTAGSMELEPNTRNVVKYAVHEIQSLLKRNNKEKRGEEALIEQLDPLYLSGTDKRMHHVDSLVYVRGKRHTNFHLDDTGLYLLWTPAGVFPESFCELLPKALRPRPLRQLCINKVSAACKTCEKSPRVTAVESTLRLVNLTQAMCLVVNSVARGAFSDSAQERIDDVFSEHIARFLNSLEVFCVENLKIHMILKNGDQCTTVATESVRCFVQKERESYCLYIDSKVNKIQLPEIHECIANELVSCLTLREDKLQTLKDLMKMLLSANSSEEIYEILQDKEVNCNGLEIPSEYDRDPNIGDTIPTSLHYRLDQSNQNIFQPQEWVAYKPTEQEEKYIFAQISHPVRLKDPSGKPLHPMNIEYVIFTSEEDTEGRTVKAFDLYKFIRGEKAPDDVPPDESESQELVPFEGDPDEVTPPPAPINVQQVREEIKQELEVISRLSSDDRKIALRRLYLKWHPDKNPDNPDIAEEIFKFIQQEMDRLDRNVGISGSTSPTPHRSWRTYQHSWNRTAREHRHYEERHSSQPTDNSSSQSRQRSRRSGGGGGVFFGGNFTPPRREGEAKRWVKQAVVDFKALGILLNEARGDPELSCHVCFMAHEVAEKALKGAMYATCGLREKTRQSHNIIPLGNAIEQVRPEKASGLSNLTAPLEPTYYEDTRFPKESSPSFIPSENFSLDNAVVAAECAEGILKIVKDITNIEV